MVLVDVVPAPHVALPSILRDVQQIQVWNLLHGYDPILLDGVLCTLLLTFRWDATKMGYDHQLRQCY